MNHRQFKNLTDCDTRCYSGRGMFGKQCVAVVTETDLPWTEILADLVEACDDCSEAASLVRSVRMDSMGMQTVLYWPSIAFDEEA